MKDNFEKSSETTKDTGLESSVTENKTELSEGELEQVGGGSKFVSSQKNTQLKAKGGRAGEEAFNDFIKS